MIMTAPAARRNLTTTGTPSSSAPAVVGRKKPRKPYTISNPRERWTAEEHESFLHALLLFGRDWKTIHQLVGTKTATQIRSHAQKFFLKARKLGLAAALPPPHPSRRAVLPLLQPPQVVRRRSSCFPEDVDAASLMVADECQLYPTAGAASSAGATRWPNHDDSFHSGGSPGDRAWFDAGCLPQDAPAVVQLPLSPDDLRFAEVYRFVGDVFDSGRIEAQLQRLRCVDPAVAETILQVLGNLQENLYG